MPSGSGVLVSVEQSVVASGAGSIATIEQSVVRSGSGTLLSIQQAVTKRLTGEGLLVSIEQQTKASGSGLLLSVEQRVRQTVATDNLSRFGWELSLYIDGAEVAANKIHGSLIVTRTENGAALLDVTLINETGVINVDAWHGKSVLVDVETSSGINRLYTGVIDIPEFDLVAKTITLQCTDKRTEQINAQLTDLLPYIGKWSSAIFDTPDDTAEELEQRLKTTLKAVDFDAYGQYRVSNLMPKAAADFTLSDSGIYRRTPRLSLASRGRLINRVNVEFEWRYTRLRHRERSFSLEGPEFCDVMTTPGLAFMSVDGVTSNLNSFGWHIKPDTLDFTYLPDAGWYNCGQGKFLWSPVVVTATTSVVTDESGNTVTDPNGNPETTVTNKTFTDYTQSFALDASWVAAKRFAQTISENISIQVDAPQSQNQYGVIEQTQRNGYEVEYDATEYEQNDSYQSPTGFSDSGGDYYLDKSGNSADYIAALNTVIAMAETTIRKSHRDNRVTLQVPLWPEIDLRHTVATTAGAIACKGKVSRITHNFDITNREAYTEIDLAFSRAQGSQSDTVLSFPILNAPVIGGYSSSILKMYTYEGSLKGGLWGDNPTTTTGIITPAIDDESRNTQQTYADYSYEIEIQNDSLTVTF